MTSQYRVNYHLRAHKRDHLIEFIKGMLLTPFVLQTEPLSTAYTDIFTNIEELINEHRLLHATSNTTRLSKIVPTIGSFFTPLPLARAFLHTDRKVNHILGRKHVPPSFNDVRRILNTAQVMAIAPQLKLVTFDGDMTLYADGANFEQDSLLTAQLVGLLKRGVAVAIVTAAGYGHNAAKYETRLSGLLKSFELARLSHKEVAQFFVLGGECNFLFKCNKQYRLEYVETPQLWTADQIARTLDVAEGELADCVRRMGIDAQIVRKPRAVGLVPRESLTREQLDECALSTQVALLSLQGSSDPGAAPVPFCAFNGGNDCWVDIGNKLIGVRIVQRLVCSPAHATLHIGDQFLSTGNDISTRTAAAPAGSSTPRRPSPFSLSSTPSCPPTPLLSPPLTPL
ncbi:IMP-specific 5-nucleotidase [Coemansia spiralis]|nr:IMP-specific 5-nucleotidase [Coemansia spiralis]